MYSSMVRPPPNPRAHRFTTSPLQECLVLKYISSTSRLRGIPSSWNVSVSGSQQSTNIWSSLGFSIKLPRRYNLQKPQALKYFWSNKSPYTALPMSSCSCSRHSITILHNRFRVVLFFAFKNVKHGLIRDYFKTTAYICGYRRFFHVCRSLYMEIS